MLTVILLCPSAFKESSRSPANHGRYGSLGSSSQEWPTLLRYACCNHHLVGRRQHRQRRSVISSCSVGALLRHHMLQPPFGGQTATPSKQGGQQPVSSGMHAATTRWWAGGNTVNAGSAPVLHTTANARLCPLNEACSRRCCDL